MKRHDEHFGNSVCRILDKGIADLDEKAGKRLYEFRQEALNRQAVPVAFLSLAGFGHITKGAVEGYFRGIVAFVALAIGAMGVNVWHNYQQARELAEIDSALLTDEVSPGAYLDQGFMEWLNRLSSQEENSLPE